jgi:Dockerin type I domain
MRGTSVVLLASLASLLCGAVSNAAEVSATITSQLRTLGTGMPVFIDISLANGSSKAMNWRRPGDYVFAVKDSAGKQVGLTPTGQWLFDSGRPHSVQFVPLSAGQKDTQTYVLSDVYDLSQPGHYTIQVIADRKEAILSNILEITVNSAKRGDLNGDGVVDQTDLAIVHNALNTAANVDPLSGKVNDARDLDGDGVITVNDVKLLTALCTYPACASHR